MTYPLSFMTKRESSFGYESSHVLRGRVSIGDIFIRGSVYFLRHVVKTFFVSFLFFTFWIHCDRKPCTLIDIYIYIYIEVVITISPISSCIVSFLSLCTCFLFIVCNLLFLFHTKML